MLKIIETGVTFHRSQLGEHFPNVSAPDVLSAEDLEHLGLEEVPDPPPLPPTAEQLRARAKADREAAVAAIKVTTAAGHTFDGDETSQGRMARAIIGLATGLAPSVPWVLADNTVIEATHADLTEALVLAGQAQAALWVLPS